MLFIDQQIRQTLKSELGISEYFDVPDYMIITNAWSLHDDMYDRHSKASAKS